MTPCSIPISSLGRGRLSAGRGARVYAPAAGEEAAALAQARDVAQVVLISREVAAPMPRGELEAALAALQPLPAIVPEDGETSPLDPAERVRAQLGLER